MEFLTIFVAGFIWYQIIAIWGISIGLHRYFSHNQNIKISKTSEVIMLFLALLAGSRSPLGWCGAHRLHHKYVDTKFDPHSPDYLGFWKVLFNYWSVSNIPISIIKDLVKNPRVMFFHKNWKYIYISFAILILLIDVYLFVTLIFIPAILGFFGYGLFNALGHKNFKPRTNLWVNILSAGEGFHNVHHNNQKLTRLNKYDISGIVIERFMK